MAKLGSDIARWAAGAGREISMNFPSRTARRLSGPSVDPLGPTARVAAIAEQQLDVIWRMARRLGVPDCDIEDVAQEVLIVVVRRQDFIELGKERAFVASVTARAGLSDAWPISYIQYIGVVSAGLPSATSGGAPPNSPIGILFLTFCLRRSIVQNA